MNLEYFALQTFIKDKIADIVIKSLNDAKHQYLETAAAAEHHRALATMYTERCNRLNQYEDSNPVVQNESVDFKIGERAVSTDDLPLTYASQGLSVAR